MIHSILVLADWCKKKTKLHKTSIMPIHDENFLDKLFEENIPAELLVKYTEEDNQD
jgi:hypothetical protein